ncbi:MAG: hypothetical protein A2Y20_06215 [Firmicutes bacterium GWF2_51_9]|nr:MAG: hypothetical protein A2Y20_06215 [Firmicutes bacterium GWF2_51_9]OGS59541.1 MAG: hypothetical protein A2Y19_11195 [Firmicutes bacterium GWE2_51_13]HAM63095.1 hypothetical protein [Erysipelotrichaceae bacterium]HBZ41165.1 hypothetical protein [Erysipelotrichaceae bacterium]
MDPIVIFIGHVYTESKIDTGSGSTIDIPYRQSDSLRVRGGDMLKFLMLLSYRNRKWLWLLPFAFFWEVMAALLKESERPKHRY